MRDSVPDPIDRVLEKLSSVKRSGPNYIARCPGHDDRKNSLSIAQGEDGRVLLKCHAGCENERIVSALGMRMADLFPRRAEGGSPSSFRTGSTTPKTITATYDYRDEGGALLFQVVRYEPKDFRQRRPDGNGGWLQSLGDVRRVLYRLPELLSADPTTLILFPEGEKDANRLAAAGFVVTTNAGGAAKWRPEYAESLRGRSVVLLPDNDPAGEQHAATIGAALTGVAAEVRVLRLPGLLPKGDVSDWFDNGGTADQLAHLIADAPLWEPGVGDGLVADEADEPWPVPQPLPEGEQLEFPVHHLPAPLSDFVAALARATQTPAALPAFMTLGVVAAASAKRVQVEIRRGWTEPVNVFLLASLPSGNRKSAVVAAAGKPLRDVETEEAVRMRVEIAQAMFKRTVAEKQLEAIQKQLARTVDRDETLRFEGDADILIRRLATDPALQVPAAPRYLVDDITPERLADLMAAQGGRLAVLSAEGGIFQTISGRYSDKRADALDLFLKGHSGDDLPIDRIGRETKHLVDPALTMAVSVQPEVLSGLAAQPGFRGKGLLARFDYACPVSTVGRREIAPDPMPPQIEADYDRLIRNILVLPVEGGTLSLSTPANAEFMMFERRLEPRLGLDGDLEHLQDWGSKLAGLVARLAGLLHVVQTVTAGARPWDRQISGETIGAAIAIAEQFLMPHARTAFGLMGADPALERARRVLRAIRDWPDEAFSRRDLHQRRLKTTFPRPDQLDRPLAMLDEYGWIRRLPLDERSGPGRTPSPVYQINPAARAQNPHNPQNASSIGHSENAAESDHHVGPEIEINEDRMEVVV